jgi:hypothetical protein
MIALAMMTLVIDAIWNSVLSPTGRCCAMFAQPAVAEKSDTPCRASPTEHPAKPPTPHCWRTSSANFAHFAEGAAIAAGAQVIATPDRMADRMKFRRVPCKVISVPGLWPAVSGNEL